MFREFGVLYGNVSDLASGAVIPDAAISTSLGQITRTDDRGEWRIEDAIATVPYTITANKQGFNPLTFDLEPLEPDRELEINFALTHPEFSLSTDLIEGRLDPGDSTTQEIELSNNGNGPLEWSVSKHILGDFDRDPWELRRSFQVGEAVGDSRIYGVVYAEGKYFFSGWNDREPLIYYEREPGMEIFDSFRQPGDDDRGMRDLTWDGELIWGPSGNMVYGITTGGEIVYEWESPLDPTTVITWDSNREVLWLGATTSNPVACTRDGELVEGLSIDRNGLRIYGLSYWGDDPDGFPLYVFNKDRETQRQTIHKFNPENGDLMFVTYLDPEHEGSPLGSFISAELDPYSWVFMNVSNIPELDGGDRIDIWQLDVKKNWFQVEPVTGVLEAGETQEMVISLNTADFDSILCEGEFRFVHDADSGKYTLPVWLAIGPVSVEKNESGFLVEFGISAVYPNPFNSWTKVSFNLDHQGQTLLVLYDVHGRLIEKLWDGDAAKGVNTIAWNASALPSGIYFARLTSNKNTHSVKILSLK